MKKPTVSFLRSNSESDEQYTPSSCLPPLTQFLDKTKTYYEATSATSKHMVEGFRDLGFDFKESSKNFFDVTSDEVYDGVITNPPYTLKDEFLKHCYDLGKPFALLLPVSSIQGMARGKMFKEFGISLLVYNRRIRWVGLGNQPAFGSAWYMGNGLTEPNRIWFTD